MPLCTQIYLYMHRIVRGMLLPCWYVNFRVRVWQICVAPILLEYESNHSLYRFWKRDFDASCTHFFMYFHLAKALPHHIVGGFHANAFSMLKELTGKMASIHEINGYAAKYLFINKEQKTIWYNSQLHQNRVLYIPEMIMGEKWKLVNIE